MSQVKLTTRNLGTMELDDPPGFSSWAKLYAAIPGYDVDSYGDSLTIEIKTDKGYVYFNLGYIRKRIIAEEVVKKLNPDPVHIHSPFISGMDIDKPPVHDALFEKYGEKSFFEILSLLDP